MSVGAIISGLGKLLGVIGKFVGVYLLRKGAVDAHKLKESEAHVEIRDEQIEIAHDAPRDRDDLDDRVRDENW